MKIVSLFWFFFFFFFGILFSKYGVIFELFSLIILIRYGNTYSLLWAHSPLHSSLSIGTIGKFDAVIFPCLISWRHSKPWHNSYFLTRSTKPLVQFLQLPENELQRNCLHAYLLFTSARFFCCGTVLSCFWSSRMAKRLLTLLWRKTIQIVLTHLFKLVSMWSSLSRYLVSKASTTLIKHISKPSMSHYNT